MKRHSAAVPTTPAPSARSVAILIALIAGCGTPAGVAPLTQPNVLVLVVDCLRADRITPAYPRPAASAIRALAAEATTFELAFSQASWTRPSVTTLLTGLYPTEHGLGAPAKVEPGPRREHVLPGSVLTVAEAMRQAGYATGLVGEQYQLSKTFALDQGFDYYAPRSSSASSIHRRFLDWAAGNGQRPFYAYLHYLELHWPYCPPPVARGTFETGESELDLCANWRRLERNIKSGAVVLTDADRRKMAERYDEELFGLDQQLRALFTKLKETDLWDNTLIILTADHGEELFEHGRSGHGYAMWDQLLHVPLVIKPPAAWGAAAGTRVDALVESRDTVATILEAAGIQLAGPARGVSLVPWLGGPAPATAPHEFVVSESNGMYVARTRDWKLILYEQPVREELYDLVNDPGETRNLAGERTTELQAMRARLQSWRRGMVAAEAVGLQPIDEETEEGLRALGYIND